MGWLVPRQVYAGLSMSSFHGPNFESGEGSMQFHANKEQSLPIPLFPDDGDGACCLKI
jgi:hypothetical protein